VDVRGKRAPRALDEPQPLPQDLEIGMRAAPPPPPPVISVSGDAPPAVSDEGREDRGRRQEEEPVAPSPQALDGSELVVELEAAPASEYAGGEAVAAPAPGPVTAEALTIVAPQFSEPSQAVALDDDEKRVEQTDGRASSCSATPTGRRR